MNSKNDPQQRDLHLGVLFHGLKVSFGLGLLAVFVIGIVFNGFSLQPAIENPVLFLVPVALRASTLLVTGYATAALALYEEVPVNLHVVVLGFFFMLVDSFGSSVAVTGTPQLQASLQFFTWLFMLLTIPLMLMGARWAVHRENSRVPMRSWLADDAPARQPLDSEANQ